MPRDNLRFIDFDLTRGLNTNFREEDTTVSGLNRLENLDLYELFRAQGQTPGTSNVQNLEVLVPTVGQGIHSYEYTDNLGVIQRFYVVVYNSTFVIARNDQAGNGAQLDFAPNAINPIDDLTGDLITRAEDFTFSETFTNDFFLTTDSFPQQWNGNTGDGVSEEMDMWGLYGPNVFPEKITQIADFSVAETWTATNASTVGPTDVTTGRFSNQAISFDHDSTNASTSVGINRTGLALNFTPSGLNTEDRSFLWFFIPRGRLKDMVQGAAVTVTYGDATLVNSDFFQFERAELAEGWNLLEMVYASPDGTNGTGATLTAIAELQVEATFAVTIPDEHPGEFICDTWYTLENGTPVAAVGAAGAITGTVRYRVTFVDDEGFESNAGPISNSVSPAAQMVDLTEVPTSSDRRVIQRRIYRDEGGAGVFTFVGELDNNTSTGFTDNVVVPNPSSVTPPLAGDVNLDNSPPPPMKKIAKVGNRIFGMDRFVPFRIVYSDLNKPRAFPLLNFFDLEETVTSIGTHNLGLLLWSNDRMFLTTEPSVGVFSASLANDQLGCVGLHGNIRVKGAQFVLYEDRVFIVGNDLQDPWMVHVPVFDKFRDDVEGTELQNTIMVSDRGRFRILFLMRTTAAPSFNNYDLMLYWQYGTQGFSQITGEGPGTDPQDLRVGIWGQIVFPSPTTTSMMGETETSDVDRPEVFMIQTDGASQGTQLRKFDRTRVDYRTNGLDNAIPSVLETAPVQIGLGPDGRGEVRYLVINGSATTQSTWTATIDLLSDANDNTIGTPVTRTFTLGPGKTSQRISYPPQGNRGRWARVRLENNNTTEDGIIQSLRLYFVPLDDFSGEATE